MPGGLLVAVFTIAYIMLCICNDSNINSNLVYTIQCVRDTFSVSPNKQRLIKTFGYMIVYICA